MKNQQPEALILANDRPSAAGDDLYQWALDAEDMIRVLHTRVQELEAMLEAVGAGGVSAQRVTQPQPLKASSDWLIDGGLLYRLNDRGTNCDEINVTMAGGLRTEAARVERAGEVLNMLKAVQQAEDHIEQPLEMVAAPAELNIDDYYCKGCGRIGEIEELSAQDKAKLRKLDGKPKTAAAPVVLPEPVYTMRVRGQFHDHTPVLLAFDLEDGEYNLYTEQQVRELLAKDIDAVNIDRLGKALTKLGHATWVSQEEAAADIPRWVNALTSCVLEMPEAAPQPQADGRDATQILIRPAAAQKIPRDPIPTVDTWETCTIKEAKELNPALWRVRMLYPQEAIDAAIAAAKGE